MAWRMKEFMVEMLRDDLMLQMSLYVRGDTRRCRRRAAHTSSPSG